MYNSNNKWLARITSCSLVFSQAAPTKLYPLINNEKWLNNLLRSMQLFSKLKLTIKKWLLSIKATVSRHLNRIQWLFLKKCQWAFSNLIKYSNKCFRLKINIKWLLWSMQSSNSNLQISSQIISNFMIICWVCLIAILISHPIFIVMFCNQTTFKRLMAPKKAK